MNVFDALIRSKYRKEIVMGWRSIYYFFLQLGTGFLLPLMYLFIVHNQPLGGLPYSFWCFLTRRLCRLIMSFLLTFIYRFSVVIDRINLPVN